MSEKVIHEIRFIETDDGFRIEVKGDKERLRQMGFDPDMGAPDMGCGMGFGPGGHRWRHMWRGKHGRGRHGHGHGHGSGHGHGPGFGPWAWWNWWMDEPEEDEPVEKPPKDV